MASSYAASPRPSRNGSGIDDDKPISILACGGDLPLEIARVLQRAGRPINVVAIAGMADADYTGFQVTTVGIGRIGALLSALRLNGATQMVIAGHARRPDLRRLRIDFGFVRHLFTILGLTRGGDDHVLRRIATFFENNGFRVLGISDVAPELLTPTGTVHGEPLPSSVADAAIQGLKLLRNLGPYDVGQALVIEDGRIIAIEGAEGTNGLLERVATGAAPGQQQMEARRTATRMLLKAAKPGQDLRLDLPTIGTETVERCASSAIQNIVLEADRSLIVSRAMTIDHASRRGVSLYGISSEAVDNGTTRHHRVTRIACLSRTRPSKADQGDAAKGLQLLQRLDDLAGVAGVLVARQNVLAINVDEPMFDFIERTKALAQWGDRREANKRNRTLAVNCVAGMSGQILSQLSSTKIAGIVIASNSDKPADIDEIVSLADEMNLFVMRAA